MKIIEKYKATLLDMAERQCVKHAKRRNPNSDAQLPGLTPKRRIKNQYRILYALTKPDGEDYSRLEVNTRNAITVTIDTPAMPHLVEKGNRVISVLASEHLVLSSNGKTKRTLNIFGGKNALEFEAESLLASRMWERGHFSLDAFRTEAGKPNSDVAITVLTQLTSALDHMEKMRPFLDVLARLPKEARAASDPRLVL